jgi:hypothetical protein
MPNGQSLAPRKLELSSRDHVCALGNSSLIFENGQDQVIGRLVLGPRMEGCDLFPADSSRSVTQAEWEDYKSGRLTSIRGKEQAADKRLRKWTQEKQKGVLPWMIKHLPVKEVPTPYATEYIRVGGLNASKTSCECTFASLMSVRRIQNDCFEVASLEVCKNSHSG